MEELPQEEAVRVEALLLEDERGRDRNAYIYANDILVANSVVPFSIWPMPNGDVLRVIRREITAEEIPYEDDNEAQKGMCFEDHRQLMAEHATGVPLCEATGYEPCLKERCPLFRHPGTKQRGEHGLCEEFKIAFLKQATLH